MNIVPAYSFFYLSLNTSISNINVYGISYSVTSRSSYTYSETFFIKNHIHFLIELDYLLWYNTITGVDTNENYRHTQKRRIVHIL